MHRENSSVKVIELLSLNEYFEKVACNPHQSVIILKTAGTQLEVTLVTVKKDLF